MNLHRCSTSHWTKQWGKQVSCHNTHSHRIHWSAITGSLGGITGILCWILAMTSQFHTVWGWKVHSRASSTCKGWTHTHTALEWNGAWMCLVMQISSLHDDPESICQFSGSNLAWAGSFYCRPLRIDADAKPSSYLFGGCEIPHIVSRQATQILQLHMNIRRTVRIQGGNINMRTSCGNTHQGALMTDLSFWSTFNTARLKPKHTIGDFPILWEDCKLEVTSRLYIQMPCTSLYAAPGTRQPP